jgi:hypothetical protein
MEITIRPVEHPNTFRKLPGSFQFWTPGAYTRRAAKYQKQTATISFFTPKKLNITPYTVHRGRNTYSYKIPRGRVNPNARFVPRTGNQLSVVATSSEETGFGFGGGPDDPTPGDFETTTRRMVGATTQTDPMDTDQPTATPAMMAAETQTPEIDTKSMETQTPETPTQTVGTQTGPDIPPAPPPPPFTPRDDGPASAPVPNRRGLLTAVTNTIRNVAGIVTSNVLDFLNELHERSQTSAEAIADKVPQIVEVLREQAKQHPEIEPSLTQLESQLNRYINTTISPVPRTLNLEPAVSQRLGQVQPFRPQQPSAVSPTTEQAKTFKSQFRVVTNGNQVPAVSPSVPLQANVPTVVAAGPSGTSTRSQLTVQTSPVQEETRPSEPIDNRFPVSPPGKRVSERKTKGVVPARFDPSPAAPPTTRPTKEGEEQEGRNGVGIFVAIKIKAGQKKGQLRWKLKKMK